MKKIIILIGGPGSGKGTQAKKIADKFNYGHISTGDLLRALAKDEHANPADKQKLADMKAGKLVADDLIYKLAFAKMNIFLDNGQGVVLDGAIRNLKQAQTYQQYFIDKNLGTEVVAMEIVLSDEESFNRLAKRRMCVRCGAIIPWLEATKDFSECPDCGGKLEVRSDDNEETIQQRIIDQGNKALKPITDYYQNLDILQKVNGSLTIEEVESQIEKLLK